MKYLKPSRLRNAFLKVVALAAVVVLNSAARMAGDSGFDDLRSILRGIPRRHVPGSSAVAN